MNFENQLKILRVDLNLNLPVRSGKGYNCVKMTDHD